MMMQQNLTGEQLYEAYALAFQEHFSHQPFYPHWQEVGEKLKVVYDTAAHMLNRKEAECANTPTSIQEAEGMSITEIMMPEVVM